MTDVYNFDADGAIIEDDLAQRRIYAQKIDSVDGKRYYVLVHGGQIVNPADINGRMGRIKSDSPRLKMAYVPEEVFNGYLSFLKGREERKLHQIRRIQRG
jgi:hypothetical protein